MIKFTPEQIEKFPLMHLSFSAMRSYMTNRQLFFKRYIRLEFDFVAGPSLIEGRAYHKALEFLWCTVQGGRPVNWEEVVEVGMRDLLSAIENTEVNFGKTGSPAKSMKVVETALTNYELEVPNYRPIAVEAKVKINEVPDLNGEILPIPLKIVYDLVSQDELSKELTIVDHKLVTTFQDEEKPAAAFELQAAASFFTALVSFRQKPVRMIFDQMKKSKNKDGSGQRRPYIIDFFDDNGKPHPCLARFTEVYRRIVMELAGLPLVDENGQMRFIPNPFDMLSGEEAWLDFCYEVEHGHPITAEELKALKAKSEEVEAIDFDF